MAILVCITKQNLHSVVISLVTSYFELASAELGKIAGPHREVFWEYRNF